MTSKKTIRVTAFTGARSEYGLLLPLLRKLEEARDISLDLIVSGMHLSTEYGLTYREIEKDGFRISEKVEMLLSADSESAIVKSTGIALLGLPDALERLKPDLLVLLGDRFETFAAATAAHLMNIPILHIHGGEVTEGATDDGLRHAITKLSLLHCTSTAEYRRRVIRMGESPKRVYHTGAIGLDNIRSLKLMDRKTLQETLGFTLRSPLAAVTFHPVTLESGSSAAQMSAMLKALEKRKDLQVVITYPNADADSRSIIGLIDEFVSRNGDRAKAFVSLGQLRYLSLLKHADLMIGNSSSGIIEAPSFGLPVVNIGNRQKGRVRAGNVIDCGTSVAAINNAIEKALTPDFRKACSRITNPYGDGKVAARILGVIRKHAGHFDVKKSFHDSSES
jgi:UDP-hydrolysing UDP-N-acetyl-D-glucosamine 2-epimerase